MIRVANISLSLDDALLVPDDSLMHEGPLVAAAANALGLPAQDVRSARMLRRSIDARKRRDVHAVLSAAVQLANPALERAAVDSHRATPWEDPAPLAYIDLPPLPDEDRPVVVGMGPAGLFCALYLARCGARPYVVEQGPAVDARARAVDAFSHGGELDPFANVQFGEGGAGAFSDGKLTTNVKHPLARHVPAWFVQAGAPRSILWDALPHIGSDRLPNVVRTMRQEIEELGGAVLFDAQLADLGLSGGRLDWVELRDVRAGGVERRRARSLVLACGHSARQLFSLAAARGLRLEAKPFSVGVRIEHPQAAIDAAQWGKAAGHAALGPATYKLAEHLAGGRSAYTFCMCPGGQVMCAASEKGGVVTNGASPFARDGENANAALLVNVEAADTGAALDPLAGIAFQRAIEQKAYRLAMDAGGAAYQAPVQTVGDFLAGRSGGRSHAVRPSYARGVAWCDLRGCLPPFVCDALAQALPRLGERMRGFADADAVLSAPETRSSSPVRIVRDRESLQAHLTSPREDGDDAAAGSGIYPAGEGAGYAGGIVSAAADGLRIGQAIARSLAERA